MNLSRIFGANWRTTIAGWLSAVTSLLTLLAAAPYELGAVAEIVPPEHKAFLFKVGAIATFLLRVIRAAQTKDAKVAGNGSVDDPARVVDRFTDRSRILGFALFASAAFALAACATAPDGRRVFDPVAATRILSAVSGALAPQPAPAPSFEPPQEFLP